MKYLTIFSPILISTILFLTVLKSVESLKCYQCGTFLATTSVSPCYNLTRDHLKECVGSCSKYVGLSTVVYGCELNCQEQRHGAFESYCCTEDRCNEGSRGDEQSVFSGSVGGGMMKGGSEAGNIYEVEHLATFQLSEELALPADGMRRLLHMEKNGFGIWSQKMKVKLESRFITILDFENGDEMEKFPLHLIRDPTAFTNPNPGELYNNIFAFIVYPVEMHIFQCFNISAADLVEDVKMALTGRLPQSRVRNASSSSLPPPPNNPPPEPPLFLVNPEDGRDDSSSGGSEGKYEREVNILNRCFDDIERFIARLQYTAAAYRELQRRRKSKKNKKKEHGEGLMSMRAKPPREKDFVDILQKFKLSFNLLARLKSHIHDPNAPELVHFLFTPLALTVDASKDAHSANLSSCVVSPLLTREAIELLNNCLTSKETELWHSLGDPWLLPREQFKGYVPSYQPVFMDGWSPMIPESNLGAAVASEAQIRMQKLARDAQVHRETDQMMSREQRSVSPIEMVGDDFNSSQRAFMDSVRSRGGRLVIVTHPRTANNNKELTVMRGEYLEVLNDSKKWWRARNWKGQVAHVPHTIVSDMDTPASYHKSNGNGNNTAHWTPPQSSNESDEEAEIQSRKKNMRKKKESPPNPPPPPPALPISNASHSSSSSPPTPSRKSYTKPPTKSENLMQQELKNVLDLFRKKQFLEIQKTPDVYINQNSSPKEVKEWLVAKNFSESVVKTLGIIEGGGLFALSKAELEKICGAKEGARLHSQITISRNVSGYKTVRSSELRNILEKARAKVEGDGRESGEVKRREVDKKKEEKSSGSGSRPKSHIPPPLPPLRKREELSSSSSDDESSLDGKSTLGRMLREKRGQMFKK